MERPNAWKTYTKNQLEELETLNDQYRAFLNVGKSTCRQADSESRGQALCSMHEEDHCFIQYWNKAFGGGNEYPGRSY